MYHITVLIFSGRRNPSWEVNAANLKAAFNIFDKAAVAADSSPAESILGYNGLQVEQGNKLWYAVQGRIFYKVADETVLVKDDPGGQFEQLLLQTAPPDVQELLQGVMS